MNDCLDWIWPVDCQLNRPETEELKEKVTNYSRLEQKNVRGKRGLPFSYDGICWGIVCMSLESENRADYVSCAVSILNLISQSKYL